MEVVEYWVPPGGVRRRENPLYTLAGLTAELADRYRWQPWDTTEFLLTGTTPTVTRFSVDFKPRRGLDETCGRIVLEIDPDADPAEVAALYRAVRPWALTADPAAAAQGRSGRRVRPQGERALALAAFVATTPGPWREVRRRWREQHPRWGEGASFEARCHEAVRRLLWPGWFPGFWGSTPAPPWGPSDVSSLRALFAEPVAAGQAAPRQVELVGRLWQNELGPQLRGERPGAGEEEPG